MKAIIAGAGPVGCLAAIELRKRSFDVHVYEKGPDPRQLNATRGPSFNVTLTLRGLKTLDDRLRDVLYQHGIPMPQRVVHHSDGSISYQAYGTQEEHHLLSIPRGVLHRTLLSEAERAGAKIRFGYDCARANVMDASALFVTDGSVVEDSGDILLGCDGANSAIRYEMSRKGGRMGISQHYIRHGYLELEMGPTENNGYALLEALRDPAIPASSHHGLHLWPRGNLVLIAQPNVDKSYTTTLFMPIQAENPDEPDFEKFNTVDKFTSFFKETFSDVVEFLPGLAQNFEGASPAPLKIIKCSPYHHGRTVLLGDSAHTMVPFYGQGINCSFEDIRIFFERLDSNIGNKANPFFVVSKTVSDYTATRTAAGDAIVDLSLANLKELARQTGEKSFHARSRLELELYKRHPEHFLTLYSMVAFSTIPYNEVVERHKQQQSLLDTLCQRFDIETQTEEIIAAYIDASTADTEQETTQADSLAISTEQLEELIKTASDYIVKFHRDLAEETYPASYVYDSLDVDAYTEGKKAAEALREYTPPQTGTDTDTVLREVFEQAIPNGTMHPHPGFMAHIPSGGLPQGAVGDFIARATNRFAGVWLAAPGLIQLESNVIKWFCTMLGYGEGSFGYITTGGSIANLMGLRCAVARSEARRIGAMRTVYFSSQGHFSIAKAARTIGISPEQTRPIPVGEDNAIDVEQLIKRVAEDRDRGYLPTCVVATAGTTDTGAIDDLVRIADFCQQENMWLHVDACFGGFFTITQRGKRALEGINRADSIAVDAHKSLFLPHGTSALLVKKQSHLRDAFEVPGAGYMPGFTTDEELVDFCNYGPELSREIRGLTAWLPIKMHGLKAFERNLDEKLDLAEYLAERLAIMDGVEIIQKHPMHLPILTFKVRARNGVDEDKLNERLCEEICSHGNVYVTTTRLSGEGLVVRICILHHRTNRAVVDQLVADISKSVFRMSRDATFSSDRALVARAS